MKFTVLLLILFSIVGCDTRVVEEDLDAPILTLDTPADQQVLAPGVIQVTGTATDTRELKEIHIEISNAVTGEQLLHVH
ncbi:MAG: hypothetical protein H7Y42_07150, partial [Chitinophagaceae bacterium]|nr:hypothetical protein [Chitinophagaceae bacterium]